jgi:AAA15 family ATPase/GTPase
MLIDFTVENFRSIKEPVTLSAIANPSREVDRPEGSATRRHIKPDNMIAPAFPVEGRGFELLPVLGIFGANASGKSNLLIALDTLFHLVSVGVSDEHYLSYHLPVFRFDKTTLQEPTRFRLRQTHQGEIFTYSLAINQDRVLQENLEYIPVPPKRRESRLLFARDWDEQSNKYIWQNGKYFAGPHTQLEDSLQKHELFLTLLASRLEVSVIEAFSDSITSRWPGVGFGRETSDHDLATLLMGKYRLGRIKDISELLCRFDTGISSLDIQKSQNALGQDAFDLFALHKTSGGLVRLPFSEESIGTQRLFVLAYKMLDSFFNGSTMLVDELGSNIHPNITREIIRQFQSPKTNPNHAQLIFTSHDNTLQQRSLLRRDQIWFTAKRDDGSTELYPLTDFKPRNDLAIDKAYLDGRFGAVPVLPDEGDLLAGLEVAR